MRAGSSRCRRAWRISRKREAAPGCRRRVTAQAGRVPPEPADHHASTFARGAVAAGSGPAQPFDPSKFGPYPPYIPKTHVDLSHLPESAIEDTHSDQGVVLWKPSVPGELPPHWLSDYRGISPGVWVPLEPRDYVPGQTHLAGG
jgi:hypothetical protein